MPSPSATQRPMSQALVEMGGGTRVALFNVSVQSDSVIGFAVPGRINSRVAVHIREVTAIKRPEFSPGRTIVFVVGVPAVALGLGWVYYFIRCSRTAC